MQVNQFELQVLAGGHPVREYGHLGKSYVEGRRSQPFTLKFRNHYACRVLVVPSIDGISTLDGKPATAQSRGYVVAGYSSIEIKGWKTSLDDTAEFIFTDKSRSYAGQTAGDANSGVIGLIVFAEHVPPPPMTIVNNPPPIHYHHHHYPEWPIYRWYYTSTTTPLEGTYCCSTGADSSIGDVKRSCATGDQVAAAINTSMASAPNSDAPDFNLGTGWGKQIVDRVIETEFQRGLQLALLEIFYSDEAGLLRAGIQLTKGPVVSKAFPQSFGGFCVPPSIVH